jgi:hypothetical protein
MFTLTLFTITRKWEQPKCPATDDNVYIHTLECPATDDNVYIHTLECPATDDNVYVHTLEFYSALKNWKKFH